MIALSIRQPWAWHILHSGKDIENRDWPTKFRGRVLVHAAKGCTRDEWENGNDPLWHCGGPTIELPVARLVVGINRQWYRIDGSLMPVPTLPQGAA